MFGKGSWLFEEGKGEIQRKGINYPMSSTLAKITKNYQEDADRKCLKGKFLIIYTISSELQAQW